MDKTSLDEKIQLIIESKAKFSDLVDLVGLDPSEDFRHLDLSGIDFGASDLWEFRFEGSILDHADLSKCMISSQTLRGVVSANGARIPRIADEFYSGRSISVRIPRKDYDFVIATFGSARRAILETISAASVTPWPVMEDHIQALLDTGEGAYEPDDRRVSVKLPIDAYEKLEDMALKVGGPRTATMRLLLKTATAALRKPSDQESVFGKFLKDFGGTIRSIRSDSPRQGFLF